MGLEVMLQDSDLLRLCQPVRFRSIFLVTVSIENICFRVSVEKR